MYIEHAPSADLAQIVACFWHARVRQETHHISRRQLQRLFQNHFGYSPR